MPSTKKKPAPLPPPDQFLAEAQPSQQQLPRQQQYPSTSSLGSSEGAYGENNYRALPYFYSNFSCQNEVADFLKHKSKNVAGYFVLRPSFRDRNNLSVSVVVSDKSVRHVNIIIENNGGQKRYFLVKEKQFSSLAQLMSYYHDHDVKNMQKVGHVRFLYGVDRPRPQRNVSDNIDTISETSSDRGPYTSPSSVGDSQEVRPPLPARPQNLPRKPSNTSNSSVGSPESPMVGAHQNAGSQLSLASTFSGLSVFQSSSDVSTRPPAPLPMGHQSKDANPYYSSPRDTSEDISDRLKEVLRESERCDCGIPRDMADLPEGWTVHRSKDPQTYGRMFYQNNLGLTSWKLPEEIQRKLNATQRANLKKLMFLQQASVSQGGYLESSRSPVSSQQNGLQYRSNNRLDNDEFLSLNNTQF